MKLSAVMRDRDNDFRYVFNLNEIFGQCLLEVNNVFVGYATAYPKFQRCFHNRGVCVFRRAHGHFRNIATPLMAEIVSPVKP